MSNGQGQGGGSPPYDDRTLLDPLSNDELRALREARQRMQAKKEGSAVAHQVVIGPDAGEDIGNAPTRSMPSLPSFEGDVSLEQISVPPSSAPQQRVTGSVQDPATVPMPPAGPTPSDPMSVLSEAETIGPTLVPTDRPEVIVTGRPLAPGKNTPPRAHGVVTPSSMQAVHTPSHFPQSRGTSADGASRASAQQTQRQSVQGGAKTNAPGFGENTLLWMQPPKHKVPNQASGGVATADFLPRASARDVMLGRLKTIGAVAVIVLLVGGLLYSSLISAPKGFIELRSTPSKAEVFIDGVKYEPTPVKLTLAEGSYRISLQRDGYETASFTASVRGEKTERRTVKMVPLSRPGLMTVRVEVQPVPARITFDGKAHDNQKTLMVPNIDPGKAHTITVEASGFVKIVQEVRTGELKNSYSFFLAKSSE